MLFLALAANEATVLGAQSAANGLFHLLLAFRGMGAVNLRDNVEILKDKLKKLDIFTEVIGQE